MSITILRPTGNIYVGCTRNTGASNCALVDEESADEDTTYVYRNTAGEVYDLYSFPASGIPTAAIIAYVRIYFRLKTYDTSGLGDGASKLKTHDTIYNGEWQNSAAYTYFYTEYAVNPNTSKPWTVSEVDAIQAGQRLYCGSSPYYARVTQMWVAISWAVPRASGPQLIGLPFF